MVEAQKNTPINGEKLLYVLSLQFNTLIWLNKPVVYMVILFNYGNFYFHRVSLFDEPRANDPIIGSWNFGLSVLLAWTTTIGQLS